jgi:hypothetical protein
LARATRDCCTTRLIPCGVLDLIERSSSSLPRDHLGLVETVDRFCERVLAVADSPERGFQAQLGKELGVPDRHVLRSPVAGVDEQAADKRPAIMQRLLERIEDEAVMRRATESPADDLPGVGIDDEGDADEDRPGGDVREVADPERVRRR